MKVLLILLMKILGAPFTLSEAHVLLGLTPVLVLTQTVVT